MILQKDKFQEGLLDNNRYFMKKLKELWALPGQDREKYFVEESSDSLCTPFAHNNNISFTE